MAKLETLPKMWRVLDLYSITDAYSFTVDWRGACAHVATSPDGAIGDGAEVKVVRDVKLEPDFGWHRELTYHIEHEGQAVMLYWLAPLYDVRNEEHRLDNTHCPSCEGERVDPTTVGDDVLVCECECGR